MTNLFMLQPRRSPEQRVSTGATGSSQPIPAHPNQTGLACTVAVFWEMDIHQGASTHSTATCRQKCYRAGNAGEYLIFGKMPKDLSCNVH